MKLIKLVLAVGAAAAIVTSSGVVAQAAADDPKCRVTVELPATGTIRSRSTAFPATLANWEGCSVESVSYRVKHPDGTPGGASSFRTGAFQSTFTLTGAGSYTTRDVSGLYTYTDADGVKRTGTVVGTRSTPMTVKFASSLSWLPATRTGSTVALRASVRRWSPSRQTYVRWQDAKVLFQARATGGWRTVASARTSAAGVAAVRLTTGRRTWRAVLVASPSVWGHSSHSHVA